MILTCPECSSRFILPEGALGEEGRKVKCSACAHIWFQSPNDVADEASVVQEETTPESFDTDELRNEIEDILENGDIADSSGVGLDAGLAEPDLDNIEPGMHGRDGVQGDEGIDPEKLRKVYGYLAAFGVFVLTLLIFLMMHGGLSQSWMGSQKLYSLFGFEMGVPAENLVFEDINVAISQNGDKDTIIVTGKIMNLSDKHIEMPSIMAFMRDDKGGVLASWPVTVKAEKAQPHGFVEIEAEYSGSAKGAVDVQVRFSLEGKPVMNHDAHKDIEHH